MLHVNVSFRTACCALLGQVLDEMQLKRKSELGLLILSYLQMRVQRSKYLRFFKQIVRAQAVTRRFLIQTIYIQLRACAVLLQYYWRKVSCVKRAKMRVRQLREACAEPVHAKLSANFGENHAPDANVLSMLLSETIPNVQEMINDKTGERLSLVDLVASHNTQSNQELAARELSDQELVALVDKASDRALFYVIFSVMLWQQAGAAVSVHASEPPPPGIPSWTDANGQLGWFMVTVKAQSAQESYTSQQQVLHASLVKGTLLLEEDRQGRRVVFGMYPLVLCNAPSFVHGMPTSAMVVVQEMRTVVWERLRLQDTTDQSRGPSAHAQQVRKVDQCGNAAGEMERVEQSHPGSLQAWQTRSLRRELRSTASQRNPWSGDSIEEDMFGSHRQSGSASSRDSPPASYHASTRKPASNIPEGQKQQLIDRVFQPWPTPLEPVMSPECLSFSSLDAKDSSKLPPDSRIGSLGQLHLALANGKSDAELIDNFRLQPKTAFTQADVDTHISIKGDLVVVDGRRRHVKWSTGKDKQPDMEGTVVSVQQLRKGVDLVNGLVTLDSGTAFRNPVDYTPEAGPGCAQARALKRGLLMRKLHGKWARCFFILSDNGELKWFHKQEITALDQAKDVTPTFEPAYDKPSTKVRTKTAQSGKQQKTKKRAMVQDVTPDHTLPDAKENVLEAFDDKELSGRLTLRFFMLQTDDGKRLSQDEPCEDETLSRSSLLATCICFNLCSGTEVLQLAADRAVATEWLELLEGQCLLNYQKAPVFLEEQVLLRIYHMDGKTSSTAIRETTTAGDLVRRLGSGQPDLNSSEWALFEHEHHETGLVDNLGSHDPTKPKLARLAHDELILDQVLTRWEKRARGIYGACPIVPKKAFMLVLRKVAPPRPKPSRAELGLEWKQIRHDLVTGRLHFNLRTSVQHNLTRRLGLHWVATATRPAGNPIESEALAKALSKKFSDKVAFTPEELDMFEVRNLRYDSYVQAFGNEKYYAIDIEAWCGLKDGDQDASRKLEQMAMVLDREVFELAALLALIYMHEKKGGDVFERPKLQSQRRPQVLLAAKQGHNPTLTFKLKPEELEAVLPSFMIPEDPAARIKLLSNLEACYNRLLRDAPKRLLLKGQGAPEDEFMTKTAELVHALRTSSRGLKFDFKGQSIVDESLAMLTVRQRLMHEPLCFGGLFDVHVWLRGDEDTVDGLAGKRPTLQPAVVTIDSHGLHLLTWEHVPRLIASLGFLLPSGLGTSWQGTLIAWQGIEHRFQTEAEKRLFNESRVLSEVSWEKVSADTPPEGVQLFNADLATWLSINAGAMQREQWKALGVKELHPHHFIKVGGAYFRPVQASAQSVALHLIVPPLEPISSAGEAPQEEAQGTLCQRTKLVLVTRDGQQILRALRQNSQCAREVQAQNFQQTDTGCGEDDDGGEGRLDSAATAAKLSTIVTPDQADDPAVDSSTKTSATGVIANIQVVSGSPLSTSQPTEREEPHHPTHLMA